MKYRFIRKDGWAKTIEVDGEPWSFVIAERPRWPARSFADPSVRMEPLRKTTFYRYEYRRGRDSVTVYAEGNDVEESDIRTEAEGVLFVRGLLRAWNSLEIILRQYVGIELSGLYGMSELRSLLETGL